MTAIFGYWNGRGLGQSIRLLLEYTGTDYKENNYVVGPSPDFDISQWTNVKYSLGLDFPNLPYYVDGEVKLTQSNAILRHIARKNNMAGATEPERANIDMLENEATDLRQKWRHLCLNPDFEEMKDQYVGEMLPAKLKELSLFLGNNKWFNGDEITYVDFLFYELFDIHKKLSPSCLDQFGKLADFVARFESLDAIEGFRKSSRFISWPLNRPTASFGGVM